VKKLLLLITLLLTGLVPLTVKGAGLSFTKGVVNSSGTLIDGVTYESFSGETTTDYGTLGKQNISYVMAASDAKTKIVTWAKTNSNKIVGGNLISIAEDYELNNPEYEVLAAINGDYYNMTDFTPVNAHVQNGITIKSQNFNLDRYFSVGFTNAEDLYVANKTNEVESYYSLTILDDGKAIKEIELQGFNQIPQEGNTSVYYNLINIPQLTDSDIFKIETIKALNYGTYYLSGQVDSEVEGIVVDEQYFSIATKSQEVADYLLNGYEVRIQKYMSGVYSGVENIIGVGSQPLEDGVIKAFEDINDQSVSFAEARHPRSGFGFTADGDFVLLAIDGRQEDMAGANLREVSKVMESLGVTNAFNLDGGGSTQLVIKNAGGFELLNSPSENRSVANALLIVAPKVMVKAETSNLSYDSFEFSLNVSDGLGQVIDYRLYMDNELISDDSLIMSFSDLTKGEIYSLSVEVDYSIGENVYTNIFANIRVNLKPFEGEYVKSPPSNFSLEITRNEAINGFDVFIRYDDPDKTLTKMYLLYDDNKEIISKAIGGYLYQMYNAEAGKDYSFKIEYYYRIDTITPVFEVTPATFYYTFQNQENPPVTTEVTTTQVITQDPEDVDPESPFTVLAIVSPILLIGLTGLVFIIKKRK
jgi:exopolysaccharide biosynthesis protein